MTQLYYSIHQDETLWPYWLLGEPITKDGFSVDSRIFTSCTPYRNNWPLEVPVSNKGRALDFSLAAHDMIIVSAALGDALERVCPLDIQRIPITVQGEAGSYEILNILESCACVDQDRSEVMFWEPSDERTDKLGQYRMVTQLAIDSKEYGGGSFFA